MSRTIQLPQPTPAQRAKKGKPRPAEASALLASVAGEEDPGAAVDAPVPPPRAPVGSEKKPARSSAPVPRPGRRN